MLYYLVTKKSFDDGEVTIERSVVQRGSVLEILRIHFCAVRK
jgi:hypothetical protein